VGSFFEIGSEFSSSMKGRDILEYPKDFLNVSCDGSDRCWTAEVTHCPASRIIFFSKYFSLRHLHLMAFSVGLQIFMATGHFGYCGLVRGPRVGK
jgi:hypothetical protein